jgi:16S rRNA (adenine1518-N6/adenine1519-N6)-dimethyltransferase
MPLPHHIRAKKSLGQNFLTDTSILQKIANSISIENKYILEVGPGYGALTDYILSAHPTYLDMVELDSDMVDILTQKYTPTVPTFPVHTAVSIHHRDILQYVPTRTPYSVIANIPYYITSPILFRFLYDLPHSPDEMVILMQEEVGEKILSGRNKKIHHSYISLCMEYRCTDIERVAYVPRIAFDPAPAVDSIVLRFTLRPRIDTDIEKAFLSLWKVAFTHPRKTLFSNLKGSIYDKESILGKVVSL